MTKFFNKFKKPCFWSIFGPFSQFWGQKQFPALSRTTSYEFLAPFQNLEKTKHTFSRKCQDRQKEGRREGRKVFSMTDKPPFITISSLDGNVELLKIT